MSSQSTDVIEVGGISVPANEAQVVLALSVLSERIGRLPVQDKEDLFELVKAAPLMQSKEDYDSFLGAFLEILEQNPLEVNDLDLSEEEQEKPEEYVNWIEWISKKIREVRQNAELTQEELANKAGLPQSHISRLERGKHSPSHMTLKKIAKALCIDVTELDPGL